MILIFGYGTVGNAVHTLFEKEKVFVEDPKHFYKIADTVIKHAKPSSLAVVSVDAPFTEGAGFNTENICTALRRLSENNFKGLVCIKSTIFGHQIKTLIESFSNLNIAAWPEFLTEANADRDIFDRQILFGGNVQQMQILQKQLKKVKDFFEFQRVTPEEAMQIKMLWNIFGAVKVSFWHSMWNSMFFSPSLIEKWKLWSSFKFRGDMCDLKKDGSYGYGGKCFPKDVLAYLEVFKNPFIAEMDKMNTIMRYGSGSHKRDYINSKQPKIQSENLV